MGQAWKKVKKHREAKRKLSDLIAKADQVIVIHYSCESFYNRPDSSSPRITENRGKPLPLGMGMHSREP